MLTDDGSLFSDTPITSVATVAAAIGTLHRTYDIPHIVVTSVSFSASATMLSVIGSTATSSREPRLFQIDVPSIPCFFSGTGDLFAALTVVRLRQAVLREGLLGTASWRSPDHVTACQLPLARAVEMVLASMQMILHKTKDAMDAELMAMVGDGTGDPLGHLQETKAAEVRLVRNLADLRNPIVQARAKPLELNS